MATPTRFASRSFDARPDRIDFRDRVYTPRLLALPVQTPEPRQIRKYLADYAAQNLVLDQRRRLYRLRPGRRDQSHGLAALAER